MTARRFALLVLTAIVAWMPVAARAEYEPPACRGLWNDSLTGAALSIALEKMDRCRRTSMHVVPIEARAARGEEVYRALIYPFEKPLPLFVEFERDRSGRAWLTLLTASDKMAVFTTRVSPSSWDAIAAGWSGLPRIVAAAKADDDAQKAAHPNIETVCIMSWDATVEVAQTGSISVLQFDACDGARFSFVSLLMTEALKDAGACATGDADEYWLLLNCLSHARLQPGRHPAVRSR